MADVGIVILNYKARDYLRRCLTTILASRGVTMRIVVVDNGGADGSVEMMRAEFPDVHLIENQNLGYSHGNNLGLRWLGFDERGFSPDAPRYALLFNPDTDVPPDAVAKLVAFMDAHPDVGITGPKLVMENGELDKACRRSFPSPRVAFYHFSGLGKRFPDSPRFARYNLTYLDPDGTYEVDSIVGACMILRPQVMQQVGLLDETFFMYGEDLDWCYRAKQAGWKVMYTAEVVVTHYKSVVARLSAKAHFEFYRAMLLFYRKHYRRSTPLPIHGLVLAALLSKGGRPLMQEIRHPSDFIPTHGRAG
jgi:GT2 family glycosyltransferase